MLTTKDDKAQAESKLPFLTMKGIGVYPEMYEFCSPVFHNDCTYRLVVQGAVLPSSDEENNVLTSASGVGQVKVNCLPCEIGF